MNDQDYVRLSARTDTPHYDQVIERLQDVTTVQILHAAMGLVTEAGEIMDALKKHLIYGVPLDLVNLREEHGDTNWYQALMARAANYTLEDAKRLNIEKLQKRYPGKFTTEAAINRDLEGERKVLEG